jgi:glucose-6-phosphate dehydrogenase assembly protein OpcA
VAAAVNAATQRTPGQRVAAAAIPAALRAIWRDCCGDEAGVDVSRALTCNFVAVADAAQLAGLRLAIDTLASRRPCRAFLVAVADSGTAMTAEVSGAMRTHGAARDLVLEQIELATPRDGFGHVAGVVRPLLVNDIPTHLYWAADWPASPHEFDVLLAMAGHAVVDSARFSAPATQLDALELRRRQGRRLTDLQWLRLRPWRRALAEAFERCAFTPGAPTAVAIRHGDGALAAAMLLGRWLEQRLGADVALAAAPLDAPCLDGVELRHGDATIAAVRSGPARIEVHVATADSCFVPFGVPASRGAEGDLLAAAIDMA